MVDLPPARPPSLPASFQQLAPRLTMATSLPFSRRPDRGDVPPFSKRGLTMATCLPFFRPETSLPFRPTSPTCLPFHFVRRHHGHVPPFFRRPLSPGQRASLFGRARAIMDTSLPFCAPRQRAPLLCSTHHAPAIMDTSLPFSGDPSRPPLTRPTCLPFRPCEGDHGDVPPFSAFSPRSPQNTWP